MINFYTRNEAATILQVSSHTISKYVRDGILNNYGTSKILKLSHEEVHSFYENVNFKNHKVQRDDLLKVEKKVSVLESEIEVLKMMIGVGTLAPPRNDEQLLELQRETMSMLLHNSWETRQIMNVGDIMINLKDVEILRLVQMKGTRAWTAFFDLSERMLHYIESMLLPRTSQEILKNRLEAGRNRLYGLLYVSISEHIAMDKYWAKKIISSRVVEKTTDEFLISFFAKCAQI